MDTNNSDSMPLGSINQRAMNKFDEIRNRMKLNLFENIVAREDYPTKNVDRKRIQDLLDHPEQNDKFSVKEESVQQQIEMSRNFVDGVFGFLGTLPLSERTKMGIGMVMSAMFSNEDSELENGIAQLREAYYGEKIDRQGT